jgi:hypothetical protein
MINLSYTILHVDKDVERENLVLKNKMYLDKSFSDIKSKSFGIYNKNQLDDYYLNNYGLSIDKTVAFRYSEIGCWASHYQAWKTFYESGMDAILILEDDIEVLNGFSENILDIMNELPQDWDAFFCLAPSGNFSYYKNSLHDIGCNRISKTYQGNWLGAYIITREGAKKLIDSCKKDINKPVDIHLFYTPDLINSYSIKPYVQNFLNGVDLGTTIHKVPRIETEDNNI